MLETLMFRANPNMNAFLLKAILAAALLIVRLFIADVSALAQNTDSIRTRFGELVLERNEDRHFQVKIGSKILFESEIEYGSIVAAFPRKNPSLVVLSIGEHSLACAGYFYIVDVSKNKPTVTDAFGNCNTAPKISYKNRILTVKFPDGSKIPEDDSGAYRYGKKEVWQYRGGKLRQIL